MIIDLNKLKKNNSLDVDICIIGAGPAGISLALEFEKSNFKVALIESGGLTISNSNQKLNYINSVDQLYENLNYQRIRSFGGTSNIWGGNCIPMEPIDFEFDKSRNYPGWPISYETIENYFIRAQQILGLNGINFGNELLNKINKNNRDKYFSWTAWQFCKYPYNFGKVFYDILNKSANILVYINANFTDFIEVQEPSLAKKALIKSLKGKNIIISSNQFILSCGGIENTKILLNIVDRKRFKSLNSIKNLGNFFAEHPSATIGFLKGNRALKIYEEHKIQYINNKIEIKPGLSISGDFQKNFDCLNGVITIWPINENQALINKIRNFISKLKNKDFSLKTIWSFFSIFAEYRNITPLVLKKIQGRAMNNFKTNIFQVILMSETIPNYNSKITLTKDTDSLGLKKVCLDWKLTDYDRHSFKKISLIAKKYFKEKYDADLLLHDWVEDYNIDWKKYINKEGHYGHHMGSTKMLNSLDSKNYIVDENLKLKNIDNIFICSSSVFPTYGFANPTLTIIALALRLADHLKKSYATKKNSN